ncbi:ABC transporter substrate-binding protein [Microbacterium sp. NIBRBAC000506063]|uniref:ABC transporter substrate-binding protein n=1 Tax=Microbacterium sp. NIBRBAC000506063 TaxID=2734618 RepID=UPI001BB6E56A|nr:ABC transporter substrate-binding protein [Microbacterium sp. NIBRBAC000506063]QTV79296.1 ABC transporter substrate-binding protein [Microbacterium sp. NIBRBAC000506063]
MSVFTSTRARKVFGSIAAVSASALILAGCAGGADPADPVDPEGPTEREPLSLSIGTVLPQTGALAFLGPPEEAGVGVAVNEVNAADLGVTISVEWGDSGDTDNRAFDTTIPRLISAGVSAIIGAASSGVTALFLDDVVASGVLTISPANTSPAFTTWDDNGLYFRTAPSDALQGEVLGNLVAEDGHETLGIIWLNDPYGSGLNDATTENFEAAGGTVVASESYNQGDTSFDAQVSTILAAQPDAIAVIAFEETSTIIPAFVANGFDGSNFYLVDGNMSQWGDDMPVSIEGSKGTTPMGADLTQDFFDSLEENWQEREGVSLDGEYSYAAESYDAVVLLALASLAANSTDSAAIAGKLREVSGGEGDGTACTTFAECAQIILDGGTANYEGLTGPIDFDENGDPTGATIGIFQFGDDNRHTRIG